MELLKNRNDQYLKIILWLSAAIEITYFSASHWFFHRWFFNALGIHGMDLESPFVIGQLQLIGALVMGYAILAVIIAGDPRRYREIMKVVLLIGCVCVAIFIGSVIAGALPSLFLINAALLAIQIGTVAYLFPWNASRSARAS